MRVDINRLRAALKSGELTEGDLQGMNITGSLYGTAPVSDRNLIPAGQDYFRNEDTGNTTFFASQPKQAVPRYRLMGAGGGSTVDLGEEQGALPPVDVSRGTIEIPGVGRGMYSRDGRYAIVDDGQGGKIKVVLGYDQAASQQGTMRNLAMQKAAQEIAHTQEQILASQDARTRREAPKPQWSNELSAWVVPPSPEAPTGRVIQPSGLPEGGNLAKASEDEKRSAGLAIRMNNALRDMDAKPEGARPQILPEILRNIPLAGEALANKVTPYERQTVEAAQLDALDAALTLATGAAYTKEQLKGLSKSYFPQLGDDERTIEDKKARLADVIQTARIRAGRAAGQIDKQTERQASRPSQSDVPQIGDVRKGYRYKGGPPSSPGSWERAS